MAKKTKKYSEWAIIGFVLSFVVPILGIIFSILALKQINEENLEGRGLAKAGLIIGICFMALMFLIIIAYFIFFILLFSLKMG